MSTRFADLGLPPAAVTSLDARGITEAFPIQSLAIPPALAGNDVCGKAPTGSGKTLAFGLPLAERVRKGRPGHPRALVLAPTRELANQICDELRVLLRPRKRFVHAFYGGVGFGPQLKALRRGVDVAVACPGRLADLVQRGNITLDEVEIVVIDEADRMADMGFLPEVKRLLDQVRPDRQTLLFSATLDGDVDVLIRRYQRDPARCEVAPPEDEEDRTTHQFVSTTREERVATAARIIGENGPTVVFCRTKHGTDRLARQLHRAGVSAVAIHGGRSQSQRQRALDSFARGGVQALVATDVAARGIHVDDVGCVLHFDVAADHKDYVHRSGRTGRAGADGIVVSLVTDADHSKVRTLQRHLDLPMVDAPAANLGAAPATPSTPTRSEPRPGNRAKPRNRSRHRNGQGGEGGQRGQGGQRGHGGGDRQGTKPGKGGPTGQGGNRRRNRNKPARARQGGAGGQRRPTSKPSRSNARPR